MNYSFYDRQQQHIFLTFDPARFSSSPEHVLIFPLYEGKIVMTEHRDRGLELPGGKVENGENFVAAAIRELWEETGAVLNGIWRIGEYTITGEDLKIEIKKAIFLAQVGDFASLPAGFETRGYRLFPLDVDVSPSTFSPFVQDGVFQHTRRYVLSEEWMNIYQITGKHIPENGG